MPVTANWNLEYESPSSLPGVTITGGPSNASPILAVQVDTALTMLSSRIDDADTDITALQADVVGLDADVTALQASITNLTNWTRVGTRSTSFTTLDSFTASVTYGFTFPAAPSVVANISDGSAAAARWDARAISPTTTGFTLFVFSNAAGSTSTWSSIPVNWTASYRP